MYYPGNDCQTSNSEDLVLGADIKTTSYTFTQYENVFYSSGHVLLEYGVQGKLGDICSSYTESEIFVCIFSMKSGRCNMGTELDKYVLCHLLSFNINR